MRAIGSEADSAATKIAKLSSAMSSFPTTAEDLGSLLTLVNENNDFGGGEQMTSADLVGMYRSNPKEFNRLMYKTAQNVYNNMEEGDDKLLQGV